ncbi:MAG: hypothetical protein AVDCRST_MAG78-316 [uncultured Rubrobacteraceae bacterium]|uniref:MOSC domain-containing protein n=1 Tax=uncultured Rubrobacteraceae bacterium TaxID=349277 RepID=A0A6J4PDF3_9ACTN|nr:MAG: hypothetical protein AVDCRST_MAG78-316 [uncultured Rubrobacteraceae bacterium]
MSNRAAQLVSVNIGRPKASPHRSKYVSSSVFKTPVEGTLKINEIELERDAQAGLGANHDYWRKLLVH